MRLWLSGYLNTLILIPMAFLLGIGAIDTYRGLTTYSDSQNTIGLTHLLDNSSSIVHEMQKERGMSAGHISSQGEKFGSDLPRQRLKLDQAIAGFKRVVAEQDFGSEVSKQLAAFNSHLGQLNNIRTKVDSQSISVSQLLSYYTANNRKLINLSSIAAHHVENRRSSQQFETLFSMANIKENAGIERAVLSTGFAASEMSQVLFVRFTTLVATQDAFLYSVQQMADKEFLGNFNKFANSSQNRAVVSFREQVIGPDLALSGDAQEWFVAATKRIDLLRADEKILITQVRAYAKKDNSVASNMIIFEIILVLLTLFLTYIIMRTLSVRTAQTVEISQVMKRVVQEKDLSGVVQVMSRGQLGDIAENLNQLTASMRSDFVAFENTAQEFSSATSQTSVVTEQSNTNLLKMRGNVSDLLNIFADLNLLIESDIQTISQATEMAEQVSTDAKAGSNIVQGAVVEINAMAKDVVLVGDAIRTLSERVVDISGMVEVIRSVADQTNLLALNAAIEAARAGEQGRGFAVVADEVRSLAKRTQESTEDISRIVDELSKSSNVAFNTIEKGHQQANSSVEMIDQINTVLVNIVEKMHGLHETNQSVAVSANEQTERVTRLGDGVSSIDASAAENALASTQISSASQRLIDLSSAMLKQIKAYKTD